jgi:alkylation response protein AidB-like acyl-CoA dehydrogenase
MADQEFLTALSDSAIELLRDECPIERVHRHIDGDAPFDRALWEKAAELGWFMLAVDEARGGMGGGAAELAMLQLALGSHVAPLPFIGTVLLGEALAGWPAGGPGDELLPQLAVGAIVGAVADPAAAPLRVTRSDGGFRIDGTVALLDGAAADWMIVPVADEAGAWGLALLTAAAPGLVRTRRPVADRTRTLVTLSCERVALPGERLAMSEEAAAIAARTGLLATLLLANDAIGGGDAILAATIEYLKTRVQFGKPIGTFQALKHRVAELKTALEMARGLVAAAVARADDADAVLWAAMAKSMACETYHRIAGEAVQMHGGIGFTWEHQAHLYLKRATLDRALFGDTATLEDRVAAGILEQAA